MKPNLTEIVTTEGKKVFAINLFDYGRIKDYFARVGNDLYHRTKNGYRLLEQDHYKKIYRDLVKEWT